MAEHVCTACEELEPDHDPEPAVGDFRTDSGPSRLCARHRDMFAEGTYETYDDG